MDPEKNPSIQGLYWCFTWQNPDDPPTPAIFAEKGRNIQYMVYQREECPTTKKHHLQGYMEFQKKTRLGTLMTQFPQGYWGRRKGTCHQAIAYCTKEDTRLSNPVFFGNPWFNPVDQTLVVDTGQERKKVSALQVITDKMMKGEQTLHDIIMEQPHVYVRHHNGLHKLAAKMQKKRNFKTEVIVFYGMPESGKSRWALELANELFSPHEIYRYSMLDSSGKEWWEGYEDEKCIIIDEMDGKKFIWERLLELLDRYELRVPYKGGSGQFGAEMILLTSNYAPREWYPDNIFESLQRRIDQCRKMTLILDERTDDGRLVYEAQMDCKNMRDPVQEKHNETLIKLNQCNGYVGSRICPPVLAFDNELLIMDDDDDDNNFE